MHFSEVPCLLHALAYYPNKLWRREQFGDPRVTMKQPRGKSKICSSVSSEDKQDVLHAGGRPYGSTYYCRIGRNCAQLHAPAAVSPDKRLGGSDSRPGGREEKENLNYYGYCEYKEPGYTGRCYSRNFTTAFNLVKPSDC
jgi:hypothetical protein